MFHFDNGLFLTEARLAIDVRRRQPRGFISHAHADHMARHEVALATPTTARLYRHRLGMHNRVIELPFRQPTEYGTVRLTTFPAGHCFGSAMLLAEHGERSLLYTGDFKLSPSATAEPAELPAADVLIMESTFGRPRYRLPARQLVIERLLEIIGAAQALGKTPVIHAYPLGKSQEVTRILTSRGIPVLQHPAIYAITRIYEQCGAQMGDVAPFAGQSVEGHAVVTLPRGMNGFRLTGLGNVVSIAATGWAMDERTPFRLGVDHALPLSDHADFDELIEAVERVNPQEIYCTHGPPEFVDHLRDRGFHALPLHPAPQRRLF